MGYLIRTNNRPFDLLHVFTRSVIDKCREEFLSLVDCGSIQKTHLLPKTGGDLLVHLEGT